MKKLIIILSVALLSLVGASAVNAAISPAPELNPIDCELPVLAPPPEGCRYIRIEVRGGCPIYRLICISEEPQQA
ncbi:hypothetical protein [Pleionea sediminis]|uniref:hypothetical protein n=1 Tax=Pleionea sediminis TaxID=2569479 RepID=UPI001184753B|nr:hypothetical protein [Pleionea sediminis]